MELLCPHCQTRLSFGDEFAGQVLKCSHCSGMFQAPSLPSFAAPAPPPPPPPPPPPVEPVASGPAPFKLLDMPASPSSSPPPVPPPVSPPPGDTFSTAPPSSAQPQSSAPTPAPSPEGYRRTYTLTFKREFITWIAPGGLALLFILSFLPWSWTPAATRIATVSIPPDPTATSSSDSTPAVLKSFTANPWSLGFVGKMTTFILYVFFFVLTAALAILSVLLDKKIVSLPEPLKKVRPYRALIVAIVAGIDFLFIFIHWISTAFSLFNPTTFWFAIAIRVHFLVVIGALLDYWLQKRRKQELPIPKIEMRW